MADNENDSDPTESTDANRRGFLKAAVTGAAAAATLVTLGGGLGVGGETASAEAPKTRLTAEEQVKEDKRAKAEVLLKELDPNLTISWVKGKAPAGRSLNVVLVG